ncbi:ABC-type multidrug transport system ATPase subunit [Planifilum fimeticola]|uniref:ABC-type multidrug transport system ATPase subunit n=1 Tax=Planifilum fimeticola TaxID=201975 RepID=A0A2T0LB02_9BACL|nr:ABC transporter ATP-binding protein [Planifilum fimeticola]PRX39038.1 ABC-type multidrug transport system ATPase subunit [Planifilum fimeticola]
MWTFDRVTVRYKEGAAALEDFSGRLAEKRIFGIVGPDGAGKSSLLKLMAGSIRPTSGRMAREGRFQIGYVSESFGLYEDMSVEENLRFYGSLYGLKRAEAEERSRDLLRRAKLLPFGGRLAGKLSGGMKRKLAIVAAVLHRPSCLILDEPTHGVDPLARREIWALIEELAREGTRVVVSTQYLDEVARCDEVLFLHRGRLLVRGSPEELIRCFPHRVFRIPEMREARVRELRRLRTVPGVVDAFPRGVHWIILAEGDEVLEPLKDHLNGMGYRREIEPAEPEFEDVFIQWMGEAEERD